MDGRDDVKTDAAPWIARVALAVVAGAAALWIGSLVVDFARGAPREERWTGAGHVAVDDGAERPGFYVVHPDPRVGYVSRPDATYTILDGVVTTDALGLRTRPGPPPADPDEALDVVILGDSVAFGFGLDDDEVLAHRLETLLASRLERPVVCRTVATSGWNQRNSIAFLRDHADVLPADVVVAIAVGNDVLDTDGVLTNGLRRWAPDPFQRHPLVPAYQGLSYPIRRAHKGTPPSELLARAGPSGLTSMLTDISRRRYADNAALLLELDAWLGSRGGELAVMPFGSDDYAPHLAVALVEAGFDGPLVPLGTTADRAHRLEGDAHPNAATTEAFAIHVARVLAAHGLVDGLDVRDLPEVPAGVAATIPPHRSHAEWRAASRAVLLAAHAALRPRVDVPSLEGIRQLAGGLNPDGTIQAEIVAVVGGAPDATAIEVELRPHDRVDALPMTVDVHVDGERVGRVELVEPGRAVVGRWDLAPGEVPREVRLVPSGWVVRERRGVRHVASCELLRVALVR